MRVLHGWSRHKGAPQGLGERGAQPKGALSRADKAAQAARFAGVENCGGRNTTETVPRGSLWVRVRMRLDQPAPEVFRTVPARATSPAMVRTGVGATGALLLQLVPAHPEGNVGGPWRAMAVWLDTAWAPVRSDCGMKPPSTMAATTTTNDQRQRSDMLQL